MNAQDDWNVSDYYGSICENDVTNIYLLHIHIFVKTVQKTPLQICQSAELRIRLEKFIGEQMKK